MFFNLFNIKDDYNNDILKIKFKNFIKSYLYVIIFIIIALMLTFVINEVIKNLGYESLIDSMKSKTKFSTFKDLIKIALIGPIIEELIFRLPLKISKININISAIVLTLLVSRILFVENKENFYLLIISILIGLVILFLLNKYYKELELKLLQNRKKFIILSILLFGLIHIQNFNTLHLELFWIYPFLVLPQITLGYFASNLRIKYGFAWALTLHILHNLITFCISNIG